MTSNVKPVEVSLARTESLLTELAYLKRGSFVQVVFACGGNPKGEELWVRITKINGDLIAGLIDSRPFATPLDIGDPVDFHFKHIFRIWGD